MRSKQPRAINDLRIYQVFRLIDPKDKGKSVLVKEEPKKVKSRDQGLAQIESDAELAQRLHEEELAELDIAQIERQRQKEATNAALTEEIICNIEVTKKSKVMKFAKNVTEEEAAEYEKEKDELRLVQERFQGHPLEGHDLLLWGDLKMLFDPDEKDELWMNQLDWKLLKWKLHENCGVHTLFMDGTPMEINMLVEKKYPVIKELLEKVLDLQLEAKEESTMVFELIKFIKLMLEE
ncbi:hypothetical protein Tco_1117690 [Tanacetum coccineum]